MRWSVRAVLLRQLGRLFLFEALAMGSPTYPIQVLFVIVESFLKNSDLYHNI